MRHRNSQLTRLALVVGIVLPITAWGQASPQAEALFRDGKRLMKEGKLAEACAAFEGSEHAEHNVATVLSLADCREKNHQYASAWALFLQADSQTRSDPTKATLNVTAKNRARALEPRMSYLTINVPDESRIPDLVVSRDGAPVDPAEWNRAIPADGGSHVIAGKAPGHESWSTTVTLRPEGDKQSVEVPRFKALPEIVNKPVRDERGYGDAPQPVIEPNPYTPRRKVAIGVAAGGVVIGGVAIGLGISASNLDNEAVATCPMSACSPQNASDARNKNQAARRRALYANIGYATAVAAVGAGVVLWIVGKPAEPSKPDAEIAVVPTAGQVNGLAVMGRF